MPKKKKKGTLSRVPPSHLIIFWYARLKIHLARCYKEPSSQCMTPHFAGLKQTPRRHHLLVFLVCRVPLTPSRIPNAIPNYILTFAWSFASLK